MIDLKGKRLLVLGGSTWKKAIADFAKDHGVTVIAAAPYRVGIFDIADESYIMDLTDAESMKIFIKEKNINGVYMGGWEPIISAACQYINELDLPCYCTKEQWDCLLDKRQFKELCIKHNLPVAPKYEVNDINITMVGDSLDYPVIMKPADGSGSHGFSVCHSALDVKDAYQRAKDYSLSGNVICEKFVKNDGVVVFYTFSNGKLFFSGLEDKYPVRYQKEGSYVGGLFVFDSDKKEEFRQLYEQKLQDLFSSIGIREGNAWIEVFCDNGQYYFNEIGFRYGGSVSIYPVDYFYHYNQVAADLYYALTGESCIEGHRSLINSSIPHKRKYCIYPIHIHAGTINKISGFDKVKEKNNVVLVNITKEKGSTVEQSASFSQVFALIHFVCDDVEECRNIINNIHKTVKVADIEGKDMINQMLDTSKIHF